MAEEKQTETSPEPATSVAKEVLVAEVPETPTEKEVLKEQPPPPPQAEKEHKRSDLETALAAEKAAEEEEKKVAEEEEKKAANVLKAAVSFKEESNLVGDLQDRERKALDEFKQLIQAAIANNEFSPPPPAPPSATAPADASTEVPKAEEAPKQPAEDSKVEETPEALVEETKAEETLKAPVEETAPAAEETSKQAVEEVKSEEEASKPAAEEAEPEEDASKAVVEEAEHEVEVSKPAEEEASKPAEEEAEVEADASKAAAVETKGEEEPPKPTAEETAPPSEEVKDATPSPPPVEAETKSVVADDDGAKTVEAIEETVVPVAAAAPPPAETTPAEAEAPAKEEEEEEEEKEKPSSEAPAVAAEPPEEVFIWGVPLLGDERSDTILLKFLRARDFKVKEAMIMLKNAVLWRKEFGIEALLAEDLGVKELEKVVFMQGSDREGHPVCYNVYGELQNKELYALAFADEEKRRRFLRWRIQFLERGIRDLLDLSPGGVSSMVQVTDLKNSIWLAKKELRQALDLLQDNYPEFSAKQIFINVPWWYLAFNRMISPFFTQRTKSKFVFAGPSRSAETLFKYIAPEQVPVQYGGLSKENDPEFTIADAVTEISIKPSTKQNIEIPVSEPCLPFWELRVLGSDVTVGAEFVPSAEDGYTIIVQKARKLSPTDEPVVKGSYKVGEAGKVILTVDNTTSKKKKLLYRYKIKASTESV